MSNASQTVEQLVERWESQRAIKNLMGKYANLVLLNREQEIMSCFWSQREDLSLGFNEGFYLGKSAVEGYYQAVTQRNMLAAKLLQKKFPEQLGDKSDEDLYGIGPFKVQPMYNPVIEIADDGETAKGLWACLGACNPMGGSGPVAYWTWGYFAVDFVKESDGWKIWHLQYVNDVQTTCGQSWGRPEKPYPPVPEFAELDTFQYPAFTVNTQVRPYYKPDRPLTLTPEIPRPYGTFSETFSYGYHEEAKN